MSHHCTAALITCEDFRLHQRSDGRNYLAEFIKDFKIDCDVITRAGGVQDLVRPQAAAFKDSIWRDLNVSVKLHQVEIIYLINHQDCGAYRGFNFSSLADEIKQHHEDLLAARELIKQKFTGMEVKIFFAELASGSSNVFMARDKNEKLGNLILGTIN